MVVCAECGASEALSRTCTLCESKFCPDHQLPESHNCSGLETHQYSTEWFLDKVKSEIEDEIGDDMGVIWECLGCGAEYGTNQRDCVSCGSTVFEPTIVSKEKELEVRPTTSRRRERERESAGREKPDYDERPDVVESECWRFDSGLTSRLYSIFGQKKNQDITSVDSEIFVIGSDEVVYQIRPTSPDSSRKFMVVEYTLNEKRGSSMVLDKNGTRTHSSEELKSRFPKRITRENTAEWDTNEQVLYRLG